MFDRSLFLNHFNTGNKNEPKVYDRISTDPRGVQWGYIAREDVYEEINTGRRLTPLMLENLIMEQTDTALGNQGDYGTEAGHGRSNLRREFLTKDDIRIFGTKPDRGRFGNFQTASTSVYKQRNSTSGGAQEAAQDLITGAVFVNTVDIPTIGYHSVRDSGQGAPGLYLHSSVDSPEGLTMGSLTGAADTLEQYFEVGNTWENLNRGGTACILTVIVDGGVAGTSADARFSDGDVVEYVWNGSEGRGVASGRQLKFNPVHINSSVDGIRVNGVGVNHTGNTGATWPSQMASAGGTAYWGHNPFFDVAIGTLNADLTMKSTVQLTTTDPDNLIEDVSQT